MRVAAASVVCMLTIVTGACARSDITQAGEETTIRAESTLQRPTTTITTTTTQPPTAGAETPAALAPPIQSPVVVPFRIEQRTADADTADFVRTVRSTLEDPRGWQQAAFDFVERPDAENLIVIAEGSEVDALCLPYETYGEYSCQNGPVVAINAERWRLATPEWTGDLPTYRVMLVNHEVGHLLGRRHTDCTRPGDPAAVMVQQSTELEGCLPNPWPLPWEISAAARHDRPIAPGYGE